MRRSGPPERRTPLERGGPLERRTPMPRGDAPRRDPEAGTRRSRGLSGGLTPIPPDAVAAVRRRSRGRCEVASGPWCSGHGEMRHHRAGRGPGRDRPDLLLDVCAACHAYLHAHPELSYERGWMISRTAPLPPDPATEVD